METRKQITAEYQSKKNNNQEEAMEHFNKSGW